VDIIEERELMPDWLSKLRGWGYSVITLADYALRREALQHGWYERAYRRKLGRAPDQAHPRAMSEKIGWLRLHDHHPLYTRLSDKLAVRDYVRERVGEEALIPLYGSWERAEDIPFDDLPERFAMKCNHESGFVILCRDRDALDRHYVRAQLATRLRMNHYYRYHEWPYLDIRPRVMAEKLLEDDEGGEPMDYKFQCFNGELQYIFVMKGRHSHPACGFYTSNWEQIPFTWSGYPITPFPRPPQLERMLEIADVLARGLPCSRVDLYAVEGKVYVGEMTLLPCAGLLVFEPDSYDFHWGERLRLPE